MADLKFDTLNLQLFRLLKTERYTIEQRVIIVKTNYRNGKNYAKTTSKISKIFGRGSVPNVSTILRVKELKKLG